MKPSSVIIWEDRLTRLSYNLTLLAAAFGIAAGSAVTMYYDLTPNMGSLEDVLYSITLVLYLLGVLVALPHLLLAALDIKIKLWKQAFVRALLFISPVIVFMGAEGLISHFLWWAPISDTDRFHLLHHSVVAGAPLALLYGLVLRAWWRPASLTPSAVPSRRFWLVSGYALLLLVMAFGITIGAISPIIFIGTTIIGIMALLALWRAAG